MDRFPSSLRHLSAIGACHHLDSDTSTKPRWDVELAGYNNASTIGRGGTMQLYVGCSGWSYSAWEGHFYPKGLASKGYLRYYSQVFDYVEIDSSFYNAPTPLMTERWAKMTPEDFLFTAKVPKSITHDSRLGQKS